ncbi:LLM class flavin-dependent oxidoreductase [Rhodococcus opacus]|uniref:LLM class flavin-dependent oxidoreductase n=1 Tax=Rhodococcus TaxID=1827 RepID=UPI0002A38211|nr:LLM class flavin-dependent oxidoreductase [Rhodococcus opacus]ELB93915.1 nitrilotriacetate monooxygenase, component A [Rhodococcus wratislaviensis IFP 2016]NHU42597.1 LLM class flavin-dependent oxidoreductase [Rhodococcus sp. A14]MDX5966868.1 LLM class flavin-dependent oxidoreductase [Rhodococcus opacus]NKY71253.1 LLM class flavin-dependent oxidoreductase [Rhodococcus opacus]CAG7584305.1 Nitrilotriacetate monooxygenase component A [Rhodococcus opacus]
MAEKQVVLGAAAPAGRTDFAVLADAARTAERGRFDFFLAEGVTAANALAGFTDTVGLAATLDTTSAEPYDVARRLASLDHLSGGRAAWNTVAPGGERASEFVDTARTLWDSWAEGVVTVDRDAGRFVSDPTAGAFYHRGRHFDIGGRFTVPRSPQAQPVVIVSGDGPEARDLAARHGDVIIAPLGTFEAGRAFYDDLARRTVEAGRPAGAVKVLSAATFVGTAASVADRIVRWVREDAADGFVLPSHLTPDELALFADTVVPLLQDRGVLRTEYITATLRQHLGLGAPRSHRAVNPRSLQKVPS